MFFVRLSANCLIIDSSFSCGFWVSTFNCLRFLECFYLTIIMIIKFNNYHIKRLPYSSLFCSYTFSLYLGFKIISISFFKFRSVINIHCKESCLPVVQENIAHAKVITSFSNMTSTVFGRNTLSARGFIYIGLSRPTHCS